MSKYPARRPLAAHLAVGIQGEALAVRHVRSLGMTVLGRNVRLGRDEIDIVAFDPSDGVMVFIEVKTRARKSQYFLPQINLTLSKKSKLLRSARKWVALHGYEGGYRIDCVCIAGRQVELYIKELSWD